MESARMDTRENNVEMERLELETDLNEAVRDGAGRNIAGVRSGFGNWRRSQMPFDDRCSVNSSVLAPNHPVTSPCWGPFKNCCGLQSRSILLASLICLLCTALVIGLSFGLTSGGAKEEILVPLPASPAQAGLNGQHYLLEPQPLYRPAESETLSSSLQSESQIPRSSRLARVPSYSYSSRSSSRQNQNQTQLSSRETRNQTVLVQTNRNQTEQNRNSNSTSSNSRSSGRSKKNQKQLPEDAASKNPVSLLHEMKLEPNFNVTHCSLHRRGTKVQSFIAYVNLPTKNSTYGPAYGRNTKEVKRRVAEMACKALYNLDYSRNNSNGSRSSVTEDPHHATHRDVCTSIP